MKTLDNINAVIFDWAGTIIDFGCLAPIHVFVALFKKHGISVGLEAAREPMGMAKKDHLETMLKMSDISEQWKAHHGNHPDKEVLESLYSELEETFISIVPQFAEPIPETKNLFDYLRNNGIKIGTTTGYVSSILNAILPLIHEKGIMPDCVVKSDDVSQGRPSPMMIYENAVQLDISPLWKAVKVGDTVADIKEGLNAGTWTVGVIRSGNEVGLSIEEIFQTDVSTLNEKTEKAQKKLKEAGAHFTVQGIWDLVPVLEKIDFMIGKGIRPESLSNKT